MTKTLYICYFGMREPLVQTQVLPYLREIRKDGVVVSLLTFEPDLAAKWSAEQIAEKKKELLETGIDWHVLPYHKRPSLPATAYDVFNGVRYVRKLVEANQIDILHARVHVPAIIAVLVRKLTRRNPKILFDIRGFVPEEYADAGVWKKGGFLFRLAKRVEAWIMRESDGFVVLTEAARNVLFPESLATGFDKLKRPIEVIPCCVDFKKRFAADRAELRASVRKELGIENRRVIIHVGSLVGLYMTPQIIEFLETAKKRDPSVFALFLTQSDPADIVSRLRGAGFTDADFLVTKVDQQQVPAYLAASDIGLSFVQSSYATLSRSPTKIPEYLACGIPVVANAGVGDVDSLIEKNRVGAVLPALDSEAYAKALDDIDALGAVTERAIETANTEFDLQEVGGLRYRRLYERLAPKASFRILYICYFGIREPLVQTQVLPYLREIGKGQYREQLPMYGSGGGLRATILSFEPNQSWDMEPMRERLAEEQIDWQCLPYHKRVSTIATSWDILRGAFFVRRFIARERPDILHGRVHTATLMGALGRKMSRQKPKLLFDIRGFFPEEYTDAGIWRKGGLLFWLAKRVERWLMKEADGFVVLTDKARDILFPKSEETGLDEGGRPVEVIPCCVDLQKFDSSNEAARGQIRSELKIGDRRLIAYVGSFGGWYLTGKMLDFFEAARKYDPDTFVMILTQRDSGGIVHGLKSKGFSDKDFYVASIEPTEIPRYLVAADSAVSFIKACYSKQSSSPTKIAEYLACGVPIICNRGVGDIDRLIDRHAVGVFVDDFSEASYLKALKQVDDLGSIGELCRAVAIDQFDLVNIGGIKYRRLYRHLLKN